MWSGNKSVVDVMVRPSAISRVARFLRDRQVSYDIIIPDLQQAINQENPLPTAEEIEELEGRNGTISQNRQIKKNIPFSITYRLQF